MNADATNTPAPAQAWSTDGVDFRYRAPLGRDLRLGDEVAVGAADPPLLGQLLSQHSVERDGVLAVEGHGRLLVTPGSVEPFDRVPLGPADAEVVARARPRLPTGIELGTLRSVPELPALIDARGFDRHTFLCGQSGSGKTYALGGLLEQLLLHTRLPLLVIDPNADHIDLARPRDDLDSQLAAAYRAAAQDVRVLHAEPSQGCASLRVAFRELGVAGAAALLELDPIRDLAEYNALIHAIAAAPAGGFSSLEAALQAFRASGDTVLDAIRQRAENLGIDRMSAWAGLSADPAPSIVTIWREQRPRALVADTSGFEQRRERLAVTVAVLEHLWAVRRDKRPLLLVVDEAHDVCPSEPVDPLQRLAVELFTRIAGEGRKYGIHLLLASQRPDKLPDNVLTQCDNLLLMRVNSAADRATLATRFGFVPAELVELAGTFGLGETLRAGPISTNPQLARTGPRLTVEGGGDVPTDWAG